MLALLLACVAPPDVGRDTPAAGDGVEEVTGDPPPTVPDPVYLHLPVFRIDTQGEITDGTKVDGTLTIVRDHDGTLDDLDTAPVDAVWPIGIELHGSSSMGYPKPGLRFECREADGSDTPCGLVDLPAASDWVLHAPYADKTLIRNAFAYTLGREVAGGGEWQPRTQFLELEVNGGYLGVYLLVERAQRDDDRLALEEPAPTAAEGDPSGGYIVKIDQNRSAGWVTARGTPVDYHEPGADRISAEQDTWLRGWFERYEDAMAADTWRDPAVGYPAWIDVPDWVDFVLQEELANNVDAYRLSTYLYKDADPVDPRLHVGPLWDFDRAYGDVNYCNCWATEGWIQENLVTCGYGYQYPFWWLALWDEPAFQDAERCRWEELRSGPLADAALSARVDALVAEVAEAQPRDQDRWRTMGEYVDPNYYVGESWSDEVEWLRGWILARAAWMDGAMPGSCGARGG